MRYLYVILAFFLFSCGSETPENMVESSEETAKPAPTKKCDPSLEKNYKGLIQSNTRLGAFEGGNVLDHEKLKAKGFDFSGVDGENDIIQHVFSPDMREIMIVRESKKDNTILEITLIARDYLTEQCIGVGSSITDFITAYAEYEIGYDAGNDSFYLSTPELMGIKFNILTTTFKGNMNEVSPRKKFKLTDFESTTKIKNVSLSDF